MSEKQLGVVEDTLYVPMLGRIYASEHFPNILNDPKALELKSELPESVTANDQQTQYTYLASASRCANMDRYIKDFMKRKPDGIIVQLGVGLETAYYRCDNGKTQWYGIDLPHVIAYRESLLPQSERETYIAADAFSDSWIREIRKTYPAEPLLVTASGLFYYFEEDKVINLLTMLADFGEIECLFDTVNKTGMNMMKKKHMKTVGHEDAQMFFYVDHADELVSKIGKGSFVIQEEPFYRHIPKQGLKLSTKVSMAVSDRFFMVKMIHLNL